MTPPPDARPADEIAEAKRNFDRLLVEQSEAERQMFLAKTQWAATSAQLLEAHFVLQELILAANR